MNAEPGIRAQRQAKTRSDLIAAAGPLFSSRGYHNTTLDMVAKAAGYTKGAVYSNFSTKDDLFLAVLQGQVEDRVHVMRSLLAGPEGKNWSNLIVGWFEDTLDPEQDFSLAETEFAIVMSRSKESRDKLESAYLPLINAMAETMRGNKSAEEADQTARLIFALSSGIMLEYARAPEKAPLAAYGEALKLLTQP